MQLRFNIDEIIETEIYYGYYTIYILGGSFVKPNPDFYIQIVNMETKEEIKLTERFLKTTDYKFWKKALRFYDFQINEYGKFRISAHNYEDIEARKSMLEIFSIPLSTYHLLLSLHPLINPIPKGTNNVEILIE